MPSFPFHVKNVFFTVEGSSEFRYPSSFANSFVFLGKTTFYHVLTCNAEPNMFVPMGTDIYHCRIRQRKCTHILRTWPNALQFWQPHNSTSILRRVASQRMHSPAIFACREHHSLPQTLIRNFVHHVHWSHRILQLFISGVWCRAQFSTTPTRIFSHNIFYPTYTIRSSTVGGSDTTLIFVLGFSICALNSEKSIFIDVLSVDAALSKSLIDLWWNKSRTVSKPPENYTSLVTVLWFWSAYASWVVKPCECVTLSRHFTPSTSINLTGPSKNPNRSLVVSSRHFFTSRQSLSSSFSAYTADCYPSEYGASWTLQM